MKFGQVLIILFAGKAVLAQNRFIPGSLVPLHNGSSVASSTGSILSSVSSRSTSGTETLSRSTDTNDVNSSSAQISSNTSSFTSIFRITVSSSNGTSISESTTESSTSSSTTEVSSDSDLGLASNTGEPTPLTTEAPQSTTELPVPSVGVTITRVVGGTTILANHFSTITLTNSANQTQPVSHSLSPRSKRIVVGCVIGIGVPILLAIIAVIVYVCVKKQRTAFINSEGKIITTYKTSRISKWWNGLLGRKVATYDSDSPLGCAPVADNDEDKSMGALRSSTRSSASAMRPSREPIVDEERYYDHEGNEITGKTY
ncbi:HFL053Wp [Eremothecium sinecaudum]|uniref:HFL053Wp n=1 Tax=Eremothecium sinecaudum TaxID=45286 RepID=A0A0X8HUT9_9SACH|nr:HFL053Wp [Eremothecium sinecaudum]AMD21803.1 HFL053Wp [Eremothecium sinecaudum]